MRLLLLLAFSGQLWGKAITYHTVRISGAGSDDRYWLIFGESALREGKGHFKSLWVQVKCLLCHGGNTWHDLCCIFFV
jgi:hypothetical protein